MCGDKALCFVDDLLDHPVFQQRRKNLLNKIHGWYDKEAKKIDSVLARLTEPAPPLARRARAKHERVTL